MGALDHTFAVSLMHFTQLRTGEDEIIDTDVYPEGVSDINYETGEAIDNFTGFVTQVMPPKVYQSYWVHFCNTEENEEEEENKKEEEEGTFLYMVSQDEYYRLMLVEGRDSREFLSDILEVSRIFGTPKVKAAVGDILAYGGALVGEEFVSVSEEDLAASWERRRTKNMNSFQELMNRNATKGGKKRGSTVKSKRS